MARSLNKTSLRGSWPDLCTSSLLARFLYEMSRFVRACAVGMHMDMSQEPFCAENFREMECSYCDTRFVRVCAVFQASFCVENFRQNARRDCCDNRFVRACAVEMRMDISQEPFCMDIYRKNGRGVDTSGDIVLCEPAQSKCTWTRAIFVWKFTVNMPNATDTTSIEHRALTLTVRTPQCGHTVCGNIVIRALRAEEGSFST